MNTAQMDHEQWICSLFERHERQLCRYAYSLIKSPDRARDAVQETFLRLCKAKRSSVQGHEAAWLYRVCRSRVLDMARKENRLRNLTDRESEQIESMESSPSEKAMRNENERLLPLEMDKLPERQKEVIRLKFQQHLSYREIAHVMNISESNVGFLIHTGLKALRDRMRILQGAVT